MQPRKNVLAASKAALKSSMHSKALTSVCKIKKQKEKKRKARAAGGIYCLLSNFLLDLDCRKHTASQAELFAVTTALDETWC